MILVPAEIPTPEMTVPTVRAGDGAMPNVRVRIEIVAVRPVERTGEEPAAQAEHGAHAAWFVALAKVEPATQLVQTRLVAVVQAAETYWPAVQLAQ